MTPRTASSRHSIESCTHQLHAWRPFVDPSPKKLCRSDRSTAPSASYHHPETLDFSRLSLLDDPQPPPPTRDHRGLRWFDRKRRRRGSRSVSGRSSDRSGTNRRRSSAAAYATCSDFPLAAGGTDSSGEMFVNGEGSWGSDVSEARVPRREMGKEIGVLERESYGGSGGGMGQGGGAGVETSLPGNESGYGSEPGYRGDGELGYGDEFDEEEDDGRLILWGDRFGSGSRRGRGRGGRGDTTDRMEIVGENEFSEQKSHHRGRRKKHDWRLIAPLR